MATLLFTIGGHIVPPPWGLSLFSDAGAGRVNISVTATASPSYSSSTWFLYLKVRESVKQNNLEWKITRRHHLDLFVIAAAKSFITLLINFVNIPSILLYFTLKKKKVENILHC